MHINTTSDNSPVHLTYCMNIHPGEDWDAVFDAVRTYACAVRERLRVEGKFGLGLRLSAKAAATLEQGSNLADFRSFLDDHGMYVFTINGFPYGQFHDTKVKEHVYEPDWSTSQRLEYTRALIRILTALLPAGTPGSISTLPGTYGRDLPAARHQAILANLCDAAIYCAEIAHDRNRTCRLAIEPEPGCLWESTADLMQLFQTDLPKYAIDSGRGGGERLREGLGVCLDTCHLAVLYENPTAALQLFQDRHIPVAKIQLSAGLICPPDPQALQQLAAFDEPVYLHQSAVHDAGVIRRFDDLGKALAALEEDTGWDEIRTHFHVPLFVSRYGALRSTADLLDDQFFAMLRTGVSDNLEVETYSFKALPKEFRSADVTENVARELQWVRDRL